MGSDVTKNKILEVFKEFLRDEGFQPFFIEHVDCSTDLFLLSEFNFIPIHYLDLILLLQERLGIEILKNNEDALEFLGPYACFVKDFSCTVDSVYLILCELSSN